jgi:hypothetical protein
VGVKEDSSIVGWGMSANGQCTPPLPNEGFLSVAAGLNHSLGLKSDGTVVAFGNNSYGQCNVPSPNADFVSIAAVHQNSYGLKSDGTIVAWGRNHLGQCDVPESNSGFLTIDCGANNGLAIRRAPETSVGDGFLATTTPGAAVISAVFPNPFNPRTTVWLDAVRPGAQTLTIHDLRGRLVRTLWRGPLQSGRHGMVWDGLDHRSQAAPSGVYLVRLAAPGGTAGQAARIVLVR